MTRSAVLVAAALLAACNPATVAPTSAPTSDAASPPATSVSATPAATDAEASLAPTAAPTSEPTAQPTAEPTPAAAGTLPPGTDLASLIPADIAGNPVVIDRPADPWSNFIQATSPESAEDILDRFGVSSTDFSMVAGVADDVDSPNVVFINVLRLAGVDGNALIGEMVPAILESITWMEATTGTVAGKHVTILAPSDPTDESSPQYFWAVGDVVFNVTGSPDEWVEEAMSKLP